MKSSTPLTSFIAAIAASAVLAACSGGASSLPSHPISPPQPGASAGGGTKSTATSSPLTATPSSLTFNDLNMSQSFTVNTTAKYATIYGASSADTSVAKVTPIGSGTNLNQFTVTSVADGATTITVVDKMGNTLNVPVTVQTRVLLVANENANTIEAFSPTANGNVAPLYTISGSNTGLFEDIGLSVDQAKNVYVSTCATSSCTYSDPSAIEEFAQGAKGNVAPISTLAGSNTNLERAGAPFFAASGQEYVAEEFAKVQIFAAGATGNTAPIAAIEGDQSITQLGYVFQVAVDSSGNIIVLNNGNPWGGPGYVEVFPPGSSGTVAPTSVLTSDLGYPRAFAFSSNGEMYIAGSDATHSNGYIEVYAPGATGNAAPLRKISGLDTNLADGNNIGNIALDETNGKIYITDFAANTISTYPISGNGDIAPTAVITGSSTGLGGPVGLLLY